MPIEYCFPNGVCNLGELANGQSGFSLQGEEAGDKSGFSVSSAGDINGDGLADLVIGAYGASPSGRTYVIFGTSNLTAWGLGSLELAQFNDGIRGFVLQGAAPIDSNGISVNCAGDINSDGVDDLVVGASGSQNGMGSTYIVFGSRNSTAWGNGIIDLEQLNGMNGFVLQGEAMGDYSGQSVAAGDINGDGIADLLIGAPGALTYTGKVYVVFGSNDPLIWGEGYLYLSQLSDGKSGFMLVGGGVSDQTGYSVSSAGDINGDELSDLLIGAPTFSPSLTKTAAGKAYIIFGNKNVTAWEKGSLSRDQLCDGLSGFALNGEAIGDYSGYSVSFAGDVNGDNISDLILGAPDATSSSGTPLAGKSYIVFGSRISGAWGSGILELSQISDGIRGFVLEGEQYYDTSGVSVSSIGDINSDGLSDLLIGAKLALSGIGKSYVIFGSKNATTWGDGVIELGQLDDGIHGFGFQGEEYGDFSGSSINSAGDINGDKLLDFIIGAPGSESSAGKSYVVFGFSQQQVTSEFSITQGATLAFTVNDLSVKDSLGDFIKGVYTIVYSENGVFELSLQNPPGQMISSFTTEQVENAEIFFIHNGADKSPVYQLSFQSPQIDGWNLGITSQVFFNPISNFRYLPSYLLSQIIDGFHGFVLKGEKTGDYTGVSVSSAGDVNGDGVVDLIAGAPQEFNGKSYIIFGSKNSTAWGNGKLIFNQLTNGIRGFELLSEGGKNGCSVSFAGDVNSDGIDDFIVGALQALNFSGASYVVFGTDNSTAWGNGTLALSQLHDGVHGFVLQGEKANDRSGASVSYSGDVNHDGIADIIIGAPQYQGLPYSRPGKSYVIFGSKNMTQWRNGVINLSQMDDGNNGFVLLGEDNGDWNGCSVSSVGDINGDGIADFITGSAEASLPGQDFVGKAYVIFGNQNISAWGDGVLPLGQLENGVRGILFEGDEASEKTGWSVSSAGDINGDDISDLVIGAPFASPNNKDSAGKAYVVFGSRNSTLWGNGTVALNQICDGIHGVILQGENSNDLAGYAVSSAGDFNGDGIGDLIIGSPQINYSQQAGSGTGKSYILFGSANNSHWGNGIINLSQLRDGVQGFLLQGEVVRDQCGYSVGSAGDLNGDGFSDIVIGAPNSGTGEITSPIFSGEVYVMFGGNPLMVQSQQLPLRSGQTLRLSVDNLKVSYTNFKKDNNAFIYTVQSVTHGQFERQLQPGFPVTQFTQADITQHKIQFVHDGSAELPVYQIEVTDSIYVRMLPSFVYFNARPVFVNNSFPVIQGQPLILNSNILAVSDRESPQGYLTILVSSLRYGQFEWVANPGVPLSQFSPLNISASAIQFVPDGSITPPTFTLSVSDQVNVFPTDGLVSFEYLPILVNNQINVNQGLATVLNSNILSASDPSGVEDQLEFVIYDIEQGQFNQIDALGGVITANITRFEQSLVSEQQIEFLHDGSPNPPSYRVAVSSGHIEIPSKPAIVTFKHAPVLELGLFIIDQGRPTIILPTSLSASDQETPDMNLVFQVSNVTAGQFEYVTTPGVPIVEFLQLSVLVSSVQFAQNGSDIAPTFAFSVNDGVITSGPQAADIDFNYQPQVVSGGFLANQSVVSGKSFDFSIDLSIFTDPDNDSLTYTAYQLDGRPLVSTMNFDGPAGRFTGSLEGVPEMSILVNASDSRQLTTSSNFTIFVSSLSSSSWILSIATPTALFSACTASAGYAYNRYRIWKHRQNNHNIFAEYLRNALNLDIYDFSNGQGMDYANQVNRMVKYLNREHQFSCQDLPTESLKAFASIVAEVIRSNYSEMVRPSTCLTRLFNFVTCYGKRWVNRMDVLDFGLNSQDIATLAVLKYRDQYVPADDAMELKRSMSQLSHPLLRPRVIN